MRETYEIRLFTNYLPVIAPDVTISKASPSLATILRGIVDDPRFKRVGELDERLRKSKEGTAFAGWDIERTYSKDELARAELFLVDVRFRHLAAEEFGHRPTVGREIEKQFRRKLIETVPAIVIGRKNMNYTAALFAERGDIA